MNQSCLVCNARGSQAKNYIKDVFSDLTILPSGIKLLHILQEVLDKSLNSNSIHSRILCRKCYKTCVDYYSFKTKMNLLKVEMVNDYAITAQNYSSTSDKPLIKEEKTMSTIVVPASKLLPVPADFQLNFSQLAGFGQMASVGQMTNGQVTISRANTVSKSKQTPLINLKVTIGSSVFTQSLKTSTVKIGKPLETIDSTSTTTSLLKKDDWNINIVPKDIFSTNEDGSQNGENGDDENGDADKGDENEMEIDEECSLAVVQDSSQREQLTFDLSNIKTESEAPQLSDDTQYINVNVLPTADGDEMVTADGNYVLGKLKILGTDDDDDDDNDEQHTIVVDGANASILEMMTGQKLIYENGELSLVMEGDEGNENEENDGDDVHDSNDESQIELQVSGDEETANAIIAAAQEQGGAFIKVESGEMYRFKSVQSGDTSHDKAEVAALVARDGNMFRCKLCDKLPNAEGQTLLEAVSMTRHLKTEHDATIYLCQLCGAGMRKRTEYNAHLSAHAQQTPAGAGAGAGAGKQHACGVCGRAYHSRALLQEHANTHSGARPHHCAVCRKAFASKYTHQAHMKTHQVRPRPFKCQQCNKSFLSQQNLNQHEKTHLGIKNFICNICNKAFGTQHNLEVHGVVHSGARPHACATCGRAFARRAELNDHCRIHTGERPFACETCGARFAQRSNLHSHRRATHLHDKRHPCTHCHKRFKRRRLLEYHIKASHTGERPLRCDVCCATFVYPEHYKKHIRIHSGERPYFCEICGKSFNSRDNRNTHRFTHSDKKPYECLTCGQSYMRKRLLIAHMNVSGHLAESIVVNQPRVTRVHNTESGVTTIVQLNDQDVVPHTDDKISDTIFQTSGKLELLEEKPTSLIKPQNDSKLFISTDNLPNETEDGVLIEAVTSTQLDTQSQLTSDANGPMLRLIQVQLPDGNDGWVALND